MKNTFIAAMFIFWGFVVAVVSAGYVVKQNRLAQEEIQKTYTESLKQITENINKGQVKPTTTVTVVTPIIDTQVKASVAKPVVVKPVPVVTPKPVPTPVVPTGITLATVAEHSTQSDCWIVINGNVYSVASYIPMHPGGSRRIANMCGGDATSGYDGQGHSSYADSLLGGYLVGPLQ